MQLAVRPEDASLLLRLATSLRLIFPVYLAALAYLVVALVGEAPPAWVALAGITWGLLVASLVEYGLHRFVLHHSNPDFVLARIHRRHHARPGEAIFGVVPVAASLALNAGCSVPIALTFGVGPVLYAVLAGQILGYLFHELAHYLAHHGESRTALGRRLRDNHDLHHFGAPARNYGFMTSLWDHVFRSHARPTTR